VAVLAVAAVWTAATAGRRLYGDWAAGQSLKRLIAEGSRPVPVRRHEEMRGDNGHDYWCFSDGQCFYAIDVFRRVYFSYNDLEDDALINELRARDGLP
jgi:hypothetical protein